MGNHKDIDIFIKEKIDKINDFSDPRAFYENFMGKINTSIEESLKNKLIENGVPLKDKRTVFIYQHYDYLKRLIFNRLDAHAPAEPFVYDQMADDIIRSYLTLTLTGRASELIGIPFGETRDWMCYCDGIYDLYYGKYKTFSHAVRVLIDKSLSKLNDEIRKKEKKEKS